MELHYKGSTVGIIRDARTLREPHVILNAQNLDLGSQSPAALPSTTLVRFGPSSDTSLQKQQRSTTPCAPRVAKLPILDTSSCRAGFTKQTMEVGRSRSGHVTVISVMFGAPLCQRVFWVGDPPKEGD